MMSANCSVVVTLSRFSRPCRTQCCSAKCLISTCFNRPGPRRVAMPMHADASSFRQAVMVYPSSLKKFASPQELTSTNSCRVKLTFTTAQSCWFLCSRPTSHARSSKHQQTTSSRPPFSSRSAHDPSHQPTNSVNCSRGRTNSRCMSRVP